MNKGVTLLLAVLVASISLSVGLGVFALLFNQLQISGTAKDSVTAFYAANSGFECAAYWQMEVARTGNDPFKQTGSPSTIQCGGTNYTVGGGDSVMYMQFNYGSSLPRSCAVVRVTFPVISGTTVRDIVSDGENRADCSSPAPLSSRVFQQGIELLIE